MATYVYFIASGSLYAYGPTDVVARVIASNVLTVIPGLTFVAGLLPQDDTHAWDPATKSVVTKVSQFTGLAPVLSDIPADITATGFVVTRAAGGAGFYNLVWAQGQVQAFRDFMISNLGTWSRPLLSEFWQYLQTKITS
jgi:hypothetical protein